MKKQNSLPVISNGKVRISQLKQRSKTRSSNIFGITEGTISKPQQFRKKCLEDIDKYYRGEQYDHLASWEDFKDSDSMKSKDAKPLLIYPFLKVLCNRISSKLLGSNTYPDVAIEQDPDFQYFVELVEREINLKVKIQSALKKLPIMGSCFIRTRLSNGKPEIEKYDTKFCYPKFDSGGELESIEIKYIFEDYDDLDNKGEPKNKWHKLELSSMKDIIYDTPEYQPNSEPQFNIVEEIDHQLGFVQGTWFRTSYDSHSPDGESFATSDLLSFIDEFNYNLSKSSEASNYGTDPQLVINGMSEDEVDDLIKSTSKAWTLGREGTAQFLEASQSGLESSNKFRDEQLSKKISDIARVVLLDPEKIVGSAQSGKAMEVLHGPMVDMINELRPYVEAGIKELYKKITATLIIMNKRGFMLSFTMPPQYEPKSFDLTFSWPPIFPMTTQDKQQIISSVIQLTSANVLSRETGLKWLMAMIPDIPVESIELELQKVAGQPQFGWSGF